MSGLFKLLIYLLALYGAYYLFTPHLKDWLPESLRPKEAPVAAPAPPASSQANPQAQQAPVPARTGPRKVVCPTCEGEGRLSYVDRRGQNHTYACPVCGFHGSNTINPPPGAHTCADCKGMGRVEYRQRRADIRANSVHYRTTTLTGGGDIVTAKPCQRCNSQGWILPRAGDGSRRQTPQVDAPNRAR